jgi:hypothetical protein
MGMEKPGISGKKAWVVAADMGLGHQRAAYPLRDLGGGEIITAGSGEYSSEYEAKQWKRLRRLYEGISRLNDLPVIGGFFFGLMDKLQEINPYYPFRDLSAPTPQVYYLNHLIRKGLGSVLVEQARSQNLPLITTFYAVAVAADYLRYPRIYLIVTDADINRVWVPAEPKKSNITYLAPCKYAYNRLKEYGVREEKIIITGFPLPQELLGGRELEILKLDLAQRLLYLDPRRRFWSLHRVEAEHYLTAKNCVKLGERLLTLTFAVGGAGAQKEIGLKILNSFKKRILNNDIRINLVAGIRQEVRDFFLEHVRKIGLSEKLGVGVNILYVSEREKYFQRFNFLLRTTDILWTKPSELSFYVGLGLPLIMAPPLGAHEHINKKWLSEINAGLPQEDPELAEEWIFELLHEGRFAGAAWDGFLKARKYGVYKIEELLTTGKTTPDTSPLKR